MPGLGQITVPRSLGIEDAAQCLEIHVFSDASELAIGYVSYLRCISAAGVVSCRFILANSKVAPRAATTIPRLELCAAVEAAQAANFILRELRRPTLSATLYSDSLVTMGYLRNSSRAFSRYVAARVQVILRNSPISSWRYIPTASNPADLASRPTTVDKLLESSWVTGPKFLLDREFSGFSEPNCPSTLPETLNKVGILATKNLRADPWDVLLRRSFSWASTVRIVARVICFCGVVRKRPVPFETACSEA